MRIQLASDLHLEHLEKHFPGEQTISPAHDADALVLAGDIGRGTSALDLFRDWPVPVLYVAGNHEAYGASWSTTVSELRDAAEGTSVRFLERDVVDCCGVRFLGCTLWTDYRLRSNRTQRQLMENAELRISDHRQIRSDAGGYFTAADALREHEKSRAWLTSELARPFDGKTVVVTHHAPHPLSVHPRYSGDPTNAAFVSDLTDLIQQGPSLWLHGHVHDSFDYSVGCCRVVANPRGYPRNASSCSRVKDLMFENPGFQCALVLDV
ncbi:metallophosphoesterase [Hydrogenophaga sp.]|uniref:metallophosphoesterase n=1 Tax=Hydrogenophaga sp. TaxID=1904254 RepID=UPI00286E1E48|nr:metallophosphoesterase [Hydrogenophaga sp.]